MIRLLIAIILLTLVSCEPVYAEELTIITDTSPMVVPAPDTSPMVVPAVVLSEQVTGIPPGTEFDVCDPLPTRTTGTAPLPENSPVLMLAGASFRQTVVPVVADVPQDYSTGTTFKAFAYPPPSMQVPVDVNITVVDRYENGAVTTTWINNATFQGQPYSYVDPTLPPESFEPNWRQMHAPVEDLVVVSPAGLSGVKGWSFASGDIQNITVTDYYDRGAVTTLWSYYSYTNNFVNPTLTPESFVPSWRQMYAPFEDTVVVDPATVSGVKTWSFTSGAIGISVTDTYHRSDVVTTWSYVSGPYVDPTTPPESLEPNWRLMYVPVVDTVVVDPATLSGFKTWSFASGNIGITVTDFYAQSVVTTTWSYNSVTFNYIDPALPPESFVPNWRQMYAPYLDTVAAVPEQTNGLRRWAFSARRLVDSHSTLEGIPLLVDVTASPGLLDIRLPASQSQFFSGKNALVLWANGPAGNTIASYVLPITVIPTVSRVP